MVSENNMMDERTKYYEKNENEVINLMEWATLSVLKYRYMDMMGK